MHRLQHFRRLPSRLRLLNICRSGYTDTKMWGNSTLVLDGKESDYYRLKRRQLVVVTGLQRSLPISFCLEDLVSISTQVDETWNSWYSPRSLSGARM